MQAAERPGADPPRFIALSYSPWSEKARWALDHHGVAYRERAYLPMIGEPVLRLAARQLRGKITVPALIDGGAVYMDSYDIARQAERLGRGEPLFPAEHADAIRRWNERSERIMAAGRALLVAAMASDGEAKRESLAAFIPGPLRGVAEPMAGLALRFLTRKYELTPATAELEDEIAGELQELARAGVADRGTIFERFSFADISMAAALQFVKPVADDHIALGPAQRRCWTRPALADQFAPLIAWRDRLYEQRRRRRRG